MSDTQRDGIVIGPVKHVTTLPAAVW